MLTLSAFAAQLSDTNDERIEYRYSIMYARSEAHRIGMGAVLEYLGDSVTTDLQDAYDSFVGAYDGLEDAVAAEDFDALWDTRLEMIDVAEDFRTEAREILGDDTAAARAAVAAALLENEEYLASLEKDVYDNHVDLVLNIFDNGVEVSEEKLAGLEEQGADTTDAEAELDEVKGMRGTLEEKLGDAYDACIGDLILVCDSDEFTDYVEYRRQTHEGFKEVARLALQAAHMNWVDKMRERLDADEEKLLALDIDTTEYEEDLEEIRALLGEAEALYADGDFAGGRDKTREARELYVDALKGIREALQEARAAALEASRAEREARAAKKPKPTADTDDGTTGNGTTANNTGAMA